MSVMNADVFLPPMNWIIVRYVMFCSVLNTLWNVNSAVLNIVKIISICVIPAYHIIAAVRRAWNASFAMNPFALTVWMIADIVKLVPDYPISKRIIRSSGKLF